MKKIYEISARLMMCFLLVSSLCILASCDDDELSTDQMSSSKIELRAFGPNPVLRGGELRFIGTNLNKVSGVVIPGSDEVTDFTKKEPTDIRITVPQDATEGYVTLHTPQGDITTKTRLTFEEPINITAITTDSVKAGSNFTVTGDYLNLIARVIFTDGVAVDTSDHENFISQSRQQLVVKVPREAQSGKIIVATAAEIPIEVYSTEDALIVLPTITGLSAKNVKAGDNITITGTDLDLVEKVVFGGGKEVVTFTPNENFTTITTAVHADAQDGVVTLVAWSGVEIPSADSVILAVPQATAITPTTVKNGASATITGTNLDLVTAIRFGDVEIPVEDLTVNEANTEIAFTVPETATADSVTLVAASGKTANLHFGGYVKPTITNVDPASVQIGGTFTITGANLDLITGVTVGGKDAGIDEQSETEIKATAPMDISIAGTDVEVALKLANGTTVTGAINITAPTYCFIPELPGADVEIKAGELLQVTVENSSKLTGVEVKNTSVQYILQGSTLYVPIPANAGGKTSLKLISGSDNISYEINVTGAGPIETVISTETVDLGGWANTLAIPTENLATGSLKIYYTSTAANPQFKIMTGSWAAQVIDDPNYDAQWNVIGVPESATSWSFALDATLLAAFSGDGGMLIGGQNIIISKVAIVTGGGGSSEIIVDETPHIVGWSGEGDGGAFRVYKANLTDLQAGKILKFYYTATGDNPQLKIQDANWGAIAIDDPNYDTQYGTLSVSPDASYYEWTVTADIVSQIMTTDDGWGDTGLVIAGQELTVTKITIVK